MSLLLLLKQPGPEVETLFTSQTPTSGNNSDGTPGITTATTVKFAVAGTVIGVRFFATTTTSGTYSVAIWSVDTSDGSPGTGTLLASKVMPRDPTPGAWNSVNFDAAVSVNPSTLYRVGVFSSAGRYVATPSFTPFVGGAGGLMNGNVFGPHNGDNPVGAITINQGTFEINASLIYPNDFGNGTSYFADPLFLSVAGGGPVDVAETVTVSDAVTRGPMLRARAIAEAVGAGDGVARLVSQARAIAEAVAAVDAVTRLVGRPRQVAETVTAADAVARAALGRARAVAEAVTAGDTVARAALGRSRAVADAVTVVDAVTRTGSGQVSVAETVQVVDAVGLGVFGRARATAETVQAVDGLSRMVGWPRSVAEAVQAVDAVVRGVLAQPARGVAEAVQLVDVVSRTGAGAAGAAAAVTVADSISRGVLAGARSVAETVAVVDGLARGPLARARAVAELLAVADVVSRTGAGAAGAAAAVNVSDQVARLVSRARGGGEVLAVTDVVTIGSGTVRGVMEAVTVADLAARGTVGRVRVVAVAVHVDAAATSPTLLRPVAGVVRVLSTPGRVRFPAGPQVRNVRRLL